jgi:hypothetical protein
MGLGSVSHKYRKEGYERIQSEFLVYSSRCYQELHYLYGLRSIQDGDCEKRATGMIIGYEEGGNSPIIQHGFHEALVLPTHTTFCFESRAIVVFA